MRSFHQVRKISGHCDSLKMRWVMLSLYRPAPWTKYCPQFASKMGTYVSRDFFLTTEFACTYVRKMYCEIFVRVIFRVIQLIPKTPMMGFVMGSHHGPLAARWCCRRRSHSHAKTTARRPPGRFVSDPSAAAVVVSPPPPAFVVTVSVTTAIRHCRHRF